MQVQLNLDTVSLQELLAATAEGYRSRMNTLSACVGRINELLAQIEKKSNLENDLNAAKTAQKQMDETHSQLEKENSRLFEENAALKTEIQKLEEQLNKSTTREEIL
ncbi:hypothetical protein IJJ08_03750 [bacterium]|nr:hypothetical protein [bacterium]